VIPFRAKLIVVCISSAVALVSFELVLRIVGAGFPVFTRIDRITGVAHVPNARGWFKREGKGWVEIDHAGLRGPERTIAKPNGTLRIALLGDSFTEALQVDDDVSFARLVERRLAARIGRPVEVLNFGVSGFGTAQEYLQLKHRVWAFAPDAVVVDVLTANDVADNHPTLNRAPHMPSFRVVDGALRLDESYLASDAQKSEDGWFAPASRSMTRHSRVLQVLHAATNALGRHDDSSAPRAAGAETGLDMDVYREPVSPVWREAWDVTERLLEAMRDEARRHGVPFYVVTLSNGPQVHPDPHVREQIARELGVPDLFYPDRRLSQFADGAAIPTLTLAPSMAEEAERHHVFFHGFGKALGTGHWNADGHRAAGERIAAWLADQQLLGADARSEQRVDEGGRGAAGEDGQGR
jgi:hypothetical protein